MANPTSSRPRQGPRLWEYLRAIPQPLRLRDLAAHLGPLGFPADPTLARSFLGTPIRHRGVQVGNFYLADKEGGQAFTREDEEVLALFASQAGAAIANARRHRAEQRARADLEALVDTSPVGVVVFDARTGHPVSLNREAKRIVGGLCLPVDQHEAAEHGSSKPRNQRWIDFLRSTPPCAMLSECYRTTFPTASTSCWSGSIQGSDR